MICGFDFRLLDYRILRIFMHEMQFLSYYLLTIYDTYAILYFEVNDRGAAYQKYISSMPHLPQMCGGDGKGWLPKAVRADDRAGSVENIGRTVKRNVWSAIAYLIVTPKVGSGCFPR